MTLPLVSNPMHSPAGARTVSNLFAAHSASRVPQGFRGWPDVETRRAAGSSGDGYAKSLCAAAFAAGYRPAVLNYRPAARASLAG